MTTIARVLILTGLFCNTTAILADDAFPGIKKLMAEDAFKRAGLDKLSDIELEQLDRWLIGYTATRHRCSAKHLQQCARWSAIRSSLAVSMGPFLDGAARLSLP